MISADVLAPFLHTNTLLGIRRDAIDDHELSGFLVGLSDDLLLLHLINGSTLDFNGYVALRVSDLTACASDKGFIGRAFAVLNRVPASPPFAANLDNMGAFLASVQAQYPLVLLEAEEAEPGHLFIGRIVWQTAQTVHLYKVNYEGVWDEEEDFELSDVTQAAAGDLYVEALAALLAHENRANPPD